MTAAALGWWIEGLLVQHLGCTPIEAEQVAGVVVAKNARRDPVMAATALATVALATPLLPGGQRWWSSDGAPARAMVLGGRADRAERLVASALGRAGSLEAVWDDAHRTAEMLAAAADDPET